MKHRVLVLCALLQLAAIQSWAGFGGQIPIGGGAGQGRPVSTTADISDADADRLRNFVRNVNGANANPFAGLNRADTKKKVRDLRATLLRLIPILRCENARIAACVQKALETNRLCIDIARPFAAASIIADDLPTCGTEPINIGILNVPCTTDLCSFTIFRLASLMLHEGLHGIQDWRGASRAQRMKVYHTNEEEASLLQVRTACELIDALNEVAMGNALPKDTPAFAAKFAREVAKKANAAAVAQALANQIRPSKDFWAATALCRRLYKVAYCLFIDGVIDRNKLNRILRRSRWFRTYGAVAGLGAYSLSYLVTSDVEIVDGDLVLQGPRMFEQIPGDGSDPIAWELPDFPEFYGGQMDASGSVIFFAAGDPNSGDGFLFSYQDTNGDGIFEQNTLRQLIQSSDLFGSFDFAVHPGNGRLFGFNPELGNFDLFLFEDLNDDQLPDQMVSAGNFAPQDVTGLGPDLMSIAFGPNGNNLFGSAEEDPESSSAFPSFWSFATAQFDAELKLYLPAPDFFPVLSPYPPIFVNPPRVGQDMIPVHGAPGSQLQLFSMLDPSNPVLLAQMFAPAGPDGSGFLEPPVPLPDEPLQLVDPVTGLTSPIIQPFPPEPLELLSLPLPQQPGGPWFLDWPTFIPEGFNLLHFSTDMIQFTGLEFAPPILWYPGDDVRTFFRTEAIGD